MKTISEHVRAVMAGQPFLMEVLREGVGNAAHIARRIRPRVEKLAYEKISLASVVMAIHRLERSKKSAWGHRFLGKLSDITVRSNVMLWYIAHQADDDRHLYRELSKIVEKYPGTFCNVIYGVKETMVLAHRDLEHALKPVLKDLKVLDKNSELSALTLRFPVESLAIPGVYYPILQAIAWEGISVIEVISVRSEFTVVCKEADIQRVLKIVTELGSGIDGK